VLDSGAAGDAEMKGYGVDVDVDATKRVRREWFWCLGTHGPGWSAPLDLATSLAALVCRAESFSPKCPFDTRFLAPLAKVVHQAIHPTYRLSKVSATPQDVSPCYAYPCTLLVPQAGYLHPLGIPFPRLIVPKPS